MSGYKIEFHSFLTEILSIQPFSPASFEPAASGRDSSGTRMEKKTRIQSIHGSQGFVPMLYLMALGTLFVQIQKLEMESIRSVVASFHQGDFLASIDIKDAHLTCTSSFTRGISGFRDIPILSLRKGPSWLLLRPLIGCRSWWPCHFCLFSLWIIRTRWFYVCISPFSRRCCRLFI